MHRRWRPRDGAGPPSGSLRTDGGEEDPDRGNDAHGGDDDTDRSDDDGPADGRSDHAGDDEVDETERAADDGDRAEPGESDDAPAEGTERADVEVVDAGESEPADPKWDRPDPEDIPEFEIGGGPPAGGSGGGGSGGGASGRRGATPDDRTDADPTAGRPNDARSPAQSRIRKEGTEGYLVAVELCARLPDDVRLPESAADLVPAAVEAELEEDVQSFAAAEFDNPTPTVDTLSFDEVDGEVWLRLRLGIPPDAFADVDPDAIRAHALQELEGMF